MSGKVTICSIGDLMICVSPLYASVGVGSAYPVCRSRLFSGCREVLDSSDIVIGNFETVVHDPGNNSLNENQMCCKEEVIKELREAGFTILNLANNHSMQHGVSGFDNTKRACENNGIQPIGVRDEKPYIIKVKGISLAFLSLCIHLEWYDPEHILYENRIGKILDAVDELRKNDPGLVIVVTVHWGDEFAHYPSNAQIALAHKFIDLGADIILGHHSHVYQGIEEYNKGIIVYSQGNFISDMIPEMCRQTGIVRIEISSPEEMKAEHELLSFKLMPYEIKKDYIPVPADGKWFGERQNRLKEALSGRLSDDDYWSDVSINHSRAHADFKKFFRSNIRKYRLGISAKMIWDFLGRKLKRVIGTTTDGRVSSMDPEIYKVLSER